MTGPRGGEALTVRVVTWNLWWRFGPWQQRWDAIRAVLRELRPDVVGLQEVWARGDDNLAGRFAEDLGLYWVWAPAAVPERWREQLDEDAAGEYEVGNAVLSRWPVLEHGAVQLPTPGGRAEGRLTLHARLDAPGHQVPFFTSHLNSGLDESAVRCAQVTALAEYVAGHRGGTDFPPVLTGDYNAWPDSDEMRLLSGVRTAPAASGQVFLDAWEYADPAAPSATWSAANPLVGGRDPSVRIDYIHVGPPGPGGLGHVRAVRRAGDGPVDGVWPSDHTAVVANLELPVR